MWYLIVFFAGLLAGFITRGLLRRKSGKIQSPGGRTLSSGVKDKIEERIKKAEASNEISKDVRADIKRLLDNAPHLRN